MYINDSKKLENIGLLTDLKYVDKTLDNTKTEEVEMTRKNFPSKSE